MHCLPFFFKRNKLATQTRNFDLVLAEKYERIHQLETQLEVSEATAAEVRRFQNVVNVEHFEELANKQGHYDLAIKARQAAENWLTLSEEGDKI